jgi:benzoyl-CoA reductase/2-hydroxyglutaryl-CoA dehydratase subunit BcrC/BadD/HgdB
METKTCCQRAAATTGSPGAADPLAWFEKMLERCHQHAVAAKAAGKRVVGILCEFTPRELIMAAGGLPVCLCGGSAKTIPAAEEHLPVNLCPLIKSTFGYHLLKTNPFLEMADLVVGETTCDGKKKMYELMAQTRPVYVLELPQKADDADALEHWYAELRKFRGFLENRFDVAVTDARLREAIVLMNRERALRRDLAGLMRAEVPPLTGRQLLSLKSSISGMADDLAQYEEVLRYHRGRPVSAPPPLRVLLTGVPTVTGAERVLEIIEQSGGRLVAMENCTGLKPILEDVDALHADPLRALAEKYFHLPCSVMTPNDRRLETLRRLIAEYRPDCVIELIWQACLTYDVESHRVRRLVEDEAGLPYLRIETDYSPSDSARIAVRVEALFETVRGSRPAAARGGP